MVSLEPSQGIATSIEKRKKKEQNILRVYVASHYAILCAL